MQKSQHHIGHLDARIVDVVLHFHALSRITQDARERIPQHGIPQMPDMRGFIRIDGCMLHDCLRGIHSRRAFLVARGVHHLSEKFAAIQVRIQITAAGHFEARHARHRPNRSRNLLRNHPRRFLQSLRQFKAHGRRHLAHFQSRRPLGQHFHVDAICEANMRRNRCPNPVYNLEIHVSPIEKRVPRL